MLEIVRICSHKDTSTNGLRLVFPEALFPFACICKLDEVCLSLNWLLYFSLFKYLAASRMFLILSFPCRPSMLLEIVWCFIL